MWKEGGECSTHSPLTSLCYVNEAEKKLKSISCTHVYMQNKNESVGFVCAPLPFPSIGRVGRLYFPDRPAEYSGTFPINLNGNGMSEQLQCFTDMLPKEGLVSEAHRRPQETGHQLKCCVLFTGNSY